MSFIAEVIPKTAEGLLGLCSQLATAGVKKVYLLMSTPGGTVREGLAVFNVLRGMPFDLVTHNVGNVDSIGNMIFLAGDERYCCPYATFMFHGVGHNVEGNTRLEGKDLRERLDGLLADQAQIGDVIASRTSISTEEISELFFEAKTRDPDYALERGIIHKICDVAVPAGAPVHQLVFKR